MDALTMTGVIGNLDSQGQIQAEVLSDQKVGFIGFIRDLKGDEIIVSRLRELGFVSGHQVKLKAKAPFGDPIVVEVNGTSVALRVGEAKCIQL